MDGEYRNLLGYLPQDFGFYPEFTVNDYLLYIATIKGVRHAVARKRTNELISKVGLAKVANKKLKKLSHGLKRVQNTTEFIHFTMKKKIRTSI